MIIGILALQGNYNQHENVLDNLGVQNLLIRNASELNSCNALIIPGGESTVISKQIDNNHLRKAIIDFALTYPILGTCAGMIMLSSTASSDNMMPLNLMDFEVKRNAWGRQIHSFSNDIVLDFDKNRLFHAVFIRAPKISSVSEGTRVLATYKDDPVLLSNGMHLASAFHPEIGGDYRIHEYFINQVNEKLPSLI